MMSRMEIMPSTLSPSTTGRWRMPFWLISASASRVRTWGETVMHLVVMMSCTCVSWTTCRQGNLARVVTLGEHPDELATFKHHQGADVVIGQNLQGIEDRVLRLEAPGVGATFLSNSRTGRILPPSVNDGS